MPAITGPALVVAALLALAGAQKLLDPTMTVGALRALGLPLGPLAVRAGAAAELVLGVAAIAVGGRVTWWLVAVSYLGLAGFVIAALRKGTMIGSCGCFGRDETPPHPSHVALNVVLATVAAAASASSGVVLDELVDHPGQAAVVAIISAASLYLLYAAYVDLPRALTAGRATR